MFVSGTIKVIGAGNYVAVRRLDERNEGVILKIVHHSLTA